MSKTDYKKFPTIKELAERFKGEEVTLVMGDIHAGMRSGKSTMFSALEAFKRLHLSEPKRPAHGETMIDGKGVTHVYDGEKWIAVSSPSKRYDEYKNELYDHSADVLSYSWDRSYLRARELIPYEASPKRKAEHKLSPLERLNHNLSKSKEAKNRLIPSMFKPKPPDQPRKIHNDAW